MLEQSGAAPALDAAALAILTDIGEAFFALDASWRFVFANREAERYLERPAAELLGQVIWEVFPQPADSPFYRAYTAARAEGRAVRTEAFAERLGVWFEVRAYPVADGVLVSVRDVTAERHASRARHESEARLRLLVGQMPALVWTCDRDLLVTSMLGRGLDALGLAPNQLVGESLVQYLRGVGLEGDPLDAHHRALRGESSGYTLEWRGRVLDVHIQPLIDDAAISGVVGVAFDVTERHRAEALARAHAELLRQIATGAALVDVLTLLARHVESQIAGAACAVLRRAGDVLRVEAGPSLPPSMTQLIDGASLELGERCRLLGARPRIACDLRGDPELGPCCDAAVACGRRACWSIPVPAADGRTLGSVLVLLDAPREPDERERRVLDEAGHIAGIAIERASAERELREAHELLAAIIETAPLGVVVVDPRARVLIWNAAAEAIYGWSRDEVMGQRHPAIPADCLPEFEASLRAPEPPSGAMAMEIERERKDGRRVELSVLKTRLRDERGAVRSVMYLVSDVTQRKRLEEQLRQSQKMEAVGRLAGGVAHDFNNLLTVIACSVDFLLAETPADDPRREDIEEVRAAAERATTLTRQLLAFSRRQVLQPRLIDLTAVAEGVQGMLQRLIGEDIALVIQRDPVSGTVLADPGQIEQVLLNLAANARDAMPEGGVLLLRVADADVAPGDPTAAGVPQGAYVELSVRDTGHGMDEETRRHVFEPFFTTKEHGRGTGLGLSTVYGIVLQSGGHVMLDSRAGIGTVVRIFLPRHAGAPETHDESAPSEGSLPRAAGHTVLLVEDADQVRALAARTLRRAGYVVLEARDAAEALEASAHALGPIHLLVSDVVMPGMGGTELARLLLERRATMRVLFTSGFTGDEFVRRGIMDGGTPFLQKPFTPEALARAAREALGPAGAR